MKIKKTTMADRQLHKLRRCIQSKNESYVSLDPVVKAKFYQDTVLNNPQALILEQKLYKAVNPSIYNAAIEESGAKKALEMSKQYFGHSVTETVKAFFSHPDGVIMRYMCENTIGKDVDGMQEHIGKVFRAWLAEHKNLS